MSKRTMSGSEILAHSRNRHEQKHLKERLEKLSHSEFLVKDNTRAEAYKLKEFIRENTRNTGWSPMAMRPDTHEEDRGDPESPESPTRRRFDLQAIQKYQRPWAYTLNTGDSHNRVYRELAQAGRSSKNALFKARHATLALIGAASMAGKNKEREGHPRLAYTVPVVVGLERARNSWVPGGNTLNEETETLPVSGLAPAQPRSSFDGVLPMSKDCRKMSIQGRAQFERQVSTASIIAKARATWVRKESSDAPQDVSDVSLDAASADESEVSKPPESPPNLAKAVVALRGVRKSVFRWQCLHCGRELKPVEETEEASESGGEGEGEEEEEGKLHKAAVAYKGLRRAKTLLGLKLLAKQSEKEDTLEKIPSQVDVDNKRRRCTCGSIPPLQRPSTGAKDVTQRSKPVNHKSKQQQKQPKQPKQLHPQKGRQSKTPVQQSSKRTDTPSSKEGTVAISKQERTRKISVVSRPKELLNIGTITDTNEQTGDGEQNSKNANGKESEVNDSDPKQRQKLIILKTTESELTSVAENGTLAADTDLSEQGHSDNNFYLDLKPDNGSKSYQEKNQCNREINGSDGLDLDKKERSSPATRLQGLTSLIDSRSEENRSSPNRLGADESLPLRIAEITKSAIKSADKPNEIDNTHEPNERLESQDKFTDSRAIPSRKSRVALDSTISRRRKLSTVSTVMSAFVKNSSCDDLSGKLRGRLLKTRSPSVSSQMSADSSGTSETGRRDSRWQLDSIICASNLAKYSDKTARNENGELVYSRPWRQRKQKTSRMEVNVFYAIARYMLKRKQQLREEKGEVELPSLGRKGDEKDQNIEEVVGDNFKSSEDNLKEINSSQEGMKERFSMQISTDNHSQDKQREKNSVKNPLSTKPDNVKILNPLSPKADEQTTQNCGVQENGLNTKTNEMTTSGEEVFASADSEHIPNLASLINPSKAPINLTNGVLDYDDDFNALTSGLQLIPGRKPVRYKGILLRNYVSPQERYKLEPMMQHKKTRSSIRWHSTEGAMVLASNSTRSDPSSRLTNVVFPKQARQRALAKMVEDNHMKPTDTSAQKADAQLRDRIDKFLLSVEPYIRRENTTPWF